MFHRLLGTVVLAGVVSGCAAAPVAAPAPSRPTTTTPLVSVPEPGSDEGGFGTPAQTDGEFPVVNPAQPVRGQLDLAENGCWYVIINGTAYLTVFPVGSATPMSDAGAIVVPDGGPLRSGAPVDGAVRWFDVDRVPGGEAGRWGNYISFCRPQHPSLAVFDTIEPAFDPSLLDTTEIEALVAGAVFTKAWACGRGWTVSTEDELVGLFVYQPFDADPATDGTITLPAAGWSAEVIIDKYLFSNHCDDTFESWEPEPVIAVRWQLTQGTIEILDDLPSGDDSAHVRASLSGAIVTTDAGTEIPLDTIELVNRSFNFFAPG